VQLAKAESPAQLTWADASPGAEIDHTPNANKTKTARTVGLIVPPSFDAWLETTRRPRRERLSDLLTKRLESWDRYPIPGG
jgi:hypothetical protein